MANTDIPISVTAGELEEAVQRVPQHEAAIANNAANIRKIEMIPRNIECKIDWNYQDSVTAVVVECDIGESHETFNTIVSMTTGKPDLFGDLSGAKSVDLCLKLVEDSQSGKTSWGLSEGYNDVNPFVKYEIRVGTYWYIVDTSPVVITGFCSFDNKNLFENYNADMTNKANIDYTNNTFSNAIKGNGTGTALKFEDVSPINHKVELSGTAGASVSVYRKNMLCFVERTVNGYTFSGSNCKIVNPTKFFGYPKGTEFTLQPGIYTFSCVVSGERTYAGRPDFRTFFKLGDVQKFISFDKFISGTDTYKTTFTITEQTQFTFLNVWFMETPTSADMSLDFQLELGSTATEYEPYKGTQTITLDENGKGEADSVSPNMTVIADSDVSVEYNKDANKIINQLIIDNANLKNAVVALGGSL